MNKDEKIKYIKENLSYSELLTALAEEASELAQACLKLRRVITPNSSPTPTSKLKAKANLLEEIADVRVSIDMIIDQDMNSEIDNIYDMKLDRFVDRLNGK